MGASLLALAKSIYYGCEKVDKTFWFCDLFVFERQCICT